MAYEKQVPSNINAERAVLGLILSDRDAIYGLADWLSPTDFYVDKHSWAYDAALSLYRGDISIDLQSVADHLRQKGQLATVGDLLYLSELSNSVVDGYQAEYYGRMVLKSSHVRKLIQAGERIQAMAFEEIPEDDKLDVFTRAQQEILKAMPESRHTEGVTLAHAANNMLARFQSGSNPGIKTGFYDLDTILGKLYPGSLCMLASRIGVESLALAIELAQNVAATSQKRVDFVSVEATDKGRVTRCAAITDRIGSHLIRTYDVNLSKSEPAIDQIDFAGLVDMLGTGYECPIIGDFSSAAIVQGIENQAQRRSARYGPAALIIIDCLQLSKVSNEQAPGDEQLSEIARGLKILARSLRVPILALYDQLSSDGSRKDNMLSINDLPDAGAIEEVADAIIFVASPANVEKSSSRRIMTDFVVTKNRYGRIGAGRLFYDADC